MKWKQKQLAPALGEQRVHPASVSECPELSGWMEKCHLSLISPIMQAVQRVGSSMCSSLQSPVCFGEAKTSGTVEVVPGSLWGGLQQGWALRLRGSTSVLAPISTS